jgi:hypothetical protein
MRGADGSDVVVPSRTRYGHSSLGRCGGDNVASPTGENKAIVQRRHAANIGNGKAPCDRTGGIENDGGPAMRTRHAQAGSRGVGGNAAAVVCESVQVRAGQIKKGKRGPIPPRDKRRPIARRTGILPRDEHASADDGEVTQADGTQFCRRSHLRQQSAIARIEPDKRRVDRGAALGTEAAVGNDQRIAEEEQLVRIVPARRPCRDATEAGVHVEDADMTGAVLLARFGRIEKLIAGAERRMTAEHEPGRRPHLLPHGASSGIEDEEEPARPARDGNREASVGRDREAMAARGKAGDGFAVSRFDASGRIEYDIELPGRGQEGRERIRCGRRRECQRTELDQEAAPINRHRAH